MFKKYISRIERSASELIISAVNLRKLSGKSLISDFFHEIRIVFIFNFVDHNSLIDFAQKIEALIKEAARPLQASKKESFQQ